MPSSTPQHEGVLVSWNDERGFGFIRPDRGGPQVFLHILDLDDTARRPQAGDTITYVLTVGKDRKPRASQARITAIAAAPTGGGSTALQAASPGLLPFLWLALLLFVPLAGMFDLFRRSGVIVPLLIYPPLSVISFLLYRGDKRRSQQRRRRTPETTLHLWDAMGGWPGGFLAQHLLPHKNRKSRFQLIFWLCVTLHYVFWISWMLVAAR